MNIPKKPAAAVTFLTAAVFLLQSCATITRGPSQKIPVTSVPVGARVLVDGKDMGTTPLTLKLKRKNPGNILIEKEGYNPHQIIIEPRLRFNPALVANFAVVPLLVAQEGSSCERGLLLFFGTLAAGFFFGMDLVLSTAIGGGYTLSPTTVDIVLTPIEGLPRLEITHIDESRLRSVTWLRIRASAGAP